MIEAARVPRLARVAFAAALLTPGCGSTTGDESASATETSSEGSQAPAGVAGQYLGTPNPPFGINERAGSPTIIAAGQMPSDVAAGSVVEVRGAHGDASITCHGTSAAPAFIVGAQGNSIGGDWNVQGQYCILENLNFVPNGDRSGALGLTGHHIAARRNESAGVPTEGPTAAFSTASSTDIVIFQNRVHDHGDVNASFDQDANGISVGPGATRVWILENETYRNSGDGINVNPYPYVESNRNSIRFVYIARNRTWGNKQSGIWAKMSADIVVSENEIYGHRPSNSSPGQCTGFQYGTERMWFLNNHIYDCDFGVLIASDLGGADGRDTYIVGNLIHDIHDHDRSATASAYSDSAIMTAGSTNRYIVNNTIQDVDSGIQAPYSGFLRIANNIVAGVDPSERHVFIEGRASVSAHNNLFDVTPRIEGASCASCSVGPPGFVDASRSDFSLSSTSSAVDAGIVDEVYATFRSLYGLDIARDRNGTLRPQGRGWDIGAYERRP